VSAKAQTSAVDAIVREGDWLALTSELEAGSVDLLYADPPFNTGAVHADEAGAFEDRFDSTDAYIAWLRERLAATLPAMKQTGNVLIHVDWRTSHRVRVLLDEVMGEASFVNHIIWSYGLGGSSPRRFARKHDDILYYAIDPQRSYFDPPMVPATSNRMKGKLKKATDVLAIPSINNMASERVGWPTQKPLALMELLVRACSPIGGTVLDPTCGSGTTLVASKRLGRKSIGFDTSAEAIALTNQRLEAI
jgi:DNA modification methylase